MIGRSTKRPEVGFEATTSGLDGNPTLFQLIYLANWGQHVNKFAKS